MTFYEFKECKTAEEYMQKYLAWKDEEENAYQLAYDMSNDWMIEDPDWNMVRNAFLIGLEVGKSRSKEQLSIALKEFVSSLSVKQKDIEPEFSEFIDKHFWELV